FDNTVNNAPRGSRNPHLLPVGQLDPQPNDRGAFVSLHRLLVFCFPLFRTLSISLYLYLYLCFSVSLSRSLSLFSLSVHAYDTDDNIIDRVVSTLARLSFIFPDNHYY